ncbi:ATP synthase F1 subunit delta [Candidatus Nomurabacteria bacterium]|nr:ATP synthase F1 subunit delta [Candidatus Nomurabacteria bacterium]
MKTLTNNAIAQAIHALSKDKSHSEQADISKKIVQFLFRRRFLSKAPDILLQLRNIINKKEDRIIVKISSAEKLSEKTKTHLEQALKKRYSAKEVILDENINQKLLGGIKIEVNNEVIDLSIKNKIEKLQEYLIKSV